MTMRTFNDFAIRLDNITTAIIDASDLLGGFAAFVAFEIASSLVSARPR